MTESAARKEPLVLSADADPLDDLFDQPDDDFPDAKARTARRPARRSGGGAGPFLIAAAASVVWIAAVAAFCWSRYSLPDNPGDAMDVVGSRIGTGDWMLIIAAILGPLVLVWIIAWLMRRTGELKRQSQELVHAATRLTQVAQTAEAAGRPLALGGMGEVTGETPRHLRREVERATHAISALHSQMRAIEEALSTQARNIDDVAERAEKRARTIATSLRTEREALERLSGEPRGAVDVAPATLGAVGTGLAAAGGIGAAGMGAVAAGIGNDDGYRADIDDVPAVDSPSDVTDFALDEARVEAAANSDAAEMLTDVPTSDDARENPVAGEAEEDAEGVEALRLRLAEARSNARWERPALPDHDGNHDHDTAEGDDPEAGFSMEPLDPFDDMDVEPFDEDDGPTTGTAATDTATTGAVAMGAAAVGAVAVGAAGAVATSSPRDEPEEYEPVGGDAPGDDEDGPFKLERRHAIDWKKFTRAANFPESEDDIETLDALYDVLTDPEAASLLQCAEDTLASLADIDLYMEDFIPRLVPVTTWRGHLDGSGGEAIEGIDALVEQTRIRAKLNADKGFEHLCAKFMDRYEDMGRRLLAETDDEKLIVDLSNTRTGRAYLMIADAAGRLSA